MPNVAMSDRSFAAGQLSRLSTVELGAQIARCGATDSRRAEK